jgi:hypothetical protein
VLDNEAVQALVDPGHHEHRRILAYVEFVTSRNVRRAESVLLIVPTAVQVEAGWDRHAPRAARINRLRADFAVLDHAAADRAAELRAALGVSVADAHIGAVLSSTAEPHAVVTSDPDDVQRVAGHFNLNVNIVRV